MRFICTSIVTVLAIGVSATAETYVVLANDISFSPPTLEVAPGDSIQWQYNSGYPHTVTSGFACVANGLFHNELNGSTPTFTWTVPDDASGEIPYFCQPHCAMGMEGAITVVTGACALTRPDVEGPYWVAGSPERSDLREDGDGPLLDLHIQVVDRDCNIVPTAWIDIWHADNDGAYDKGGWGYRGHHWTNPGGASLLETVIPGLYPGRTRHIHAKVQGTTDTIFTTQLYFPDVPENDSDFFYHPDLEVTVLSEDDDTGDMVAAFEFILDESAADLCPADLNGDGEVGVNEILTIIEVWGTDDADADITGDGIVGVDDLLTVISAWGPCP